MIKVSPLFLILLSLLYSLENTTELLYVIPTSFVYLYIFKFKITFIFILSSYEYINCPSSILPVILIGLLSKSSNKSYSLYFIYIHSHPSVITQGLMIYCSATCVLLFNFISGYL